MKFNFKKGAQALLGKMAPKLTGLAGEGLYGLVCAATLYPVAQAMQQSSTAGQQAIAATLATMGINVLSNRIQRWKDVNDAARDIAALPPDAPEHAELASALAEADALSVIEGKLEQDQAAEFKKVFRNEMKHLGHWTTYSAQVKNGAAALGRRNNAADRGAVILGRDARARDIVSGTVKTTIVKRERDKSGLALKNYLQALLAECDDLPLAAMGGQKGVGDEMTLSDIYQDLDTEREVKDSRIRSEVPSGPEMAIRWRKGQEPRPLKAMEAARQFRYLALLGGPGSGKSAFVNTLASRLATKTLSARKGDDKRKTAGADAPSLAKTFGIPARLLVRQMVNSLAALDLPWDVPERCREPLAALVRDHWQAELRRCGALDAWEPIDAALRAGKATMIFDGLDEVPLPIRQRARQAISAAVGAYPKARCIVTCRSRSYPSAPLEGFEAVTLALFDQEKIKSFVRAFYRTRVNALGLTDDQVKTRIQGLEDAVMGRLSALSPTPLLLMVMAIVHRTNVVLPTERVKLFDLAIDVLVLRWQQHKFGLEISVKVQHFLDDERLRRKVLERIAYDMHAIQSRDHDPEAALSRYEILPWLEQNEYLGEAAGAFLDYVDQTSGLLIGYGGGDGSSGPPATYGFPHRQLQEHLAGRYLIQGSTTQRRRTYLLRAAEDDFWSEPAQLGAETLLYADTDDSRLSELIFSIVPGQSPQNIVEWRATLWAGRMAALAGIDRVKRDAVNAGEPDFLHGRLIPRLLALLNNDKLPGIERAEAGNVLAELGDPRFDPDFFHLPYDHTHGMRGFVKIPAGTFRMGEDVKTHSVTLLDFYMARWLVTWAQYRHFVKDAEHPTTGIWVEPDADDGPDNLPVWGVNWHDAMAYCDWLDARLREDSRTPAAILSILRQGGSVTLPSEAEWERVARGGTDAAYPWGENADPNRANCAQTGIRGTSAVGCFPGVENRYSFGCDDLLGNVWEWTRSWHREYPYVADDREERKDHEGDEARVVRGGSCNDSARNARCAVRGWGHKDLRLNSLGAGFRVVLSPFPASRKETTNDAKV